MSKSLNRKVGELTPDKLFAGITPASHVNSGTLGAMAAETTYPRGTVLAKDSAGKLYILGTTGSLTPDCILCDDTTVGTGADITTAIYTAGCFNTNALTVKSGYTMTIADIDKLRERGIYLGEVME